MKEIILIAPPRVLGELRKQLSAKARTKVTGEIDKDLSRHPIPEIEKALAREFKESTRRRTRALPDAESAGSGSWTAFRVQIDAAGRDKLRRTGGAGCPGSRRCRGEFR